MKTKTETKDGAWPPTGVRDLKPDVPVSAVADRMKFPTLRNAIKRAAASTATPVTLDMHAEHLVAKCTAGTAAAAVPLDLLTQARPSEPHGCHTGRAHANTITAVTPNTLTKQHVRNMLRHNCRDVEDLCRAYLFGSAPMQTRDLQRLCDAINKFDRAPAP